MGKKSGGGCLLVVVIAAAVLGFGYYKSKHGSSDSPPDGPATGGGTGRYVALGDSYTSSPKTGNAAGTPAGCDRSTNNYPHLVSAKINPAEFVDVSCSGATTDHLTGAQATRNGTNPPQLGALNAETTLVTLGIGGNDVGFIGIGSTCATTNANASPCRDRLTAGGRDQLAEGIEATAPRIGQVLDKIHEKAPQARVIVVGYPTVLPDGDGCWPTLPVGSGDVAYFREALGKLNDMLADQAKSHDAGFADTATPSKGHDLCTAAGTRWIEPVVPAAKAISLHPNAKGEQGMADVVLKLLD
ncbi:SGNH/GDSL hydrolase family protein [Amycolatopsis sp. cg5]|uniref:SGNH/GDSL hydrolase family protein n=1 Tax=Amycolatopsis sp. cg5 TaxID=3238802 RepID=UPI003523EAD5